MTVNQNTDCMNSNLHRGIMSGVLFPGWLYPRELNYNPYLPHPIYRTLFTAPYLPQTTIYCNQFLSPFQAFIIKDKYTKPLFTANPDLPRAIPSSKYRGKSGFYFMLRCCGISSVDRIQYYWELVNEYWKIGQHFSYLNDRMPLPIGWEQSHVSSYCKIAVLFFFLLKESNLILLFLLNIYFLCEK